MTRHPAKFSDAVLEEIEHTLNEVGRPKRVIDPFAGVGRVHDLALRHVVGIEIEPEWATMHPGNIVGNALCLPFPDATFDGLITSPTYANRMADHHNAQDPSRRRSYTHDLGRKLHPDNSGVLQWGDAYREFHDRAWAECLRVLQPDSVIVLNISNHIRRGAEQPVAEWHMNWFMDHGCFVERLGSVITPRMRYGANRDQRSRCEYVFAMRYVAPVYTPEDEEDPIDEDHWVAEPPQRAELADDLDARQGR